jgi:phosphoserine phosphatase
LASWRRPSAPRRPASATHPIAWAAPCACPPPSPSPGPAHTPHLPSHTAAWPWLQRVSTSVSFLHHRPSPHTFISTHFHSKFSATVKRDASPDVLTTLAAAEAFCFDVDSTFCEDESIDELAAFLGVGEEVAALTARAMGGTVLFQDALRDRLGVMNPNASDVDAFLAAHPHLLSSGIPELLAALRSAGKEIFLVSGGFRQIIHPLAESLQIPIAHVFANTLLFHPETGAFQGFDPEEFTSRSGGKAEAVVHIKKEWGFKTVVMVGDGATDAEARRPGGADLFIGYGGTVARQAVANQADWYVMAVQEITDALQAVGAKK